MTTKMVSKKKNNTRDVYLGYLVTMVTVMGIGVWLFKHQ